jgi:hypothetical protein
MLEKLQCRPNIGKSLYGKIIPPRRTRSAKSENPEAKGVKQNQGARLLLDPRLPT